MLGSRITARLLLPALVAVFALTALPACAPAGESGAGAARGPITQDLIRNAGITGTAYDAVRNLRPQWLRTRGGTDQIRVYIDGNRVGSRSTSLASVAVQDVGRIERMSASEATTRYGTGAGGHPDGALLLTTRR